MTPPHSTTALRLALLGLSLGYFMVLFDTTALTVALPDLSRDLGGGVQALAWVTDAYTLTFAGCLLMGGVLADRHGAGRTFTAGLAGFGVLSLACAVAPSAWVLIALRALLGLAGALLLPASLSLITALYPAADRRAEAIAAWASISATALAAGPLLGGALVAGFGWRGIFLVNAPVAVVAAVLLGGRLPQTGRRTVHVDPRGQAGVLVAVASVTWALIRGGAEGWGRPDVLAAAIVAVVAGGLAVRAERRSVAPAVPRALLRQPRYTGALVGGLVVGAVLAGELFLTTLQLQRGLGLGPVLTGVAFLPLTVPMVVNPRFAGRLVARVGPARPVLGGLFLITVATTLLAAAGAAASYAWIAVGLLLLGFGISFTLPALTSAAVLAAPPGATGAAGGLFSVMRQIGATVGVAGVAAVIGAGASHLGGGHGLLAVAAALATAGWWATGGRPGRPTRRQVTRRDGAASPTMDGQRV